MAIKAISFQVLINGEDESQYIVDMAFKAGLCNPIGQLEITIAPEIGRDILPYETVQVYLEGTKVFTGYAQTHVQARRPVRQSLFCEDALAKVRDSWNTDLTWESHGTESITYWMEKFLDIADVSYTTPGGGPPAPAKVWGPTNCYEAIKGLLRYVNWQLAVNASGTINIKLYNINEGQAITVDEIANYEHFQSDNWLRNRAIVIGRNQEASVILDADVPELGNEIRSAIFASGEIIWPGTAYLMAELMLNEFSDPWDTITVDTPGNPNIRIGSTVHITENWEGTDRYGLVTSLQWRLNESEGYVTNLTIDEKCPSFWLSDKEPNILYCSTDGEGVWKTHNNGKNWFDISGEELVDAASYVKDIHVLKGESFIGTDDTIWAATLGGIFKTETGTNPWTDMTENMMDTRSPYMDWWGVITDPGDADIVYCLGNYLADTIHYAIYVYVSKNNGETWTSYPVNPFDWES